MVNESWLNTLRKSRKSITQKNAGVGILASEIANLMTKAVCLWDSLTDAEISRLNAELSKSSGIKVLVSSDGKYLMELALNEMLDEFKFLARHVVRLSKKCVDPVYHQYEQLNALSTVNALSKTASKRK